METILFVDDDPVILEVAEEYFKIKGYQVVTAANGCEAMSVIERHDVDCCFTDINMPEMDGIELAENIHKSNNTIPVVVMTGFPSLDNTIRTVKNGVVDFLIKPVNLNQMEICLQRVLRERTLLIENLLLKKEVEQKKRLEEVNRELMEKVEELWILNRIITGLTAADAVSDVFARAVQMAVDITAADDSRFYVYDQASNRLREAAVRSRKKLPPPADSMLIEMAGGRTPILIAEKASVPGLPEAVRSFMAVPLAIRDKTFGILTAAGSEIQFTEKDLYYLSCMARNSAHAVENLALYEHIHENLFSTLYAFVKALEARDPYTQQHSERVTEISVILGEELGCDKEDLDMLRVAGLLHDIGKLGIPDAILLKPGPLTREEFEKIKQHPDIGAAIVGQLGFWEREQELIRRHHERYDGKGYPHGLRRDQIPLLARILSVADAYDAMASDRAYRKRMPVEDIRKVIRNGSGTQFDPDVSEAFLRLQAEGKIPDGVPYS